MVITKLFFKSLGSISGVSGTIVTAAVAAGFDKVINYYCVQGNSFFGLLYFNRCEFCPISSNFIVILSIFLGVMAFMLLSSITADIIIWPIRVIIRKRKNIAEIEENFLYK